MTEGSPQRPGAEAFLVPDRVNQRRYEAVRAWYVEGLTYQQAADRFGYTRWAMIDLVRQCRAGKLDLFAPPRKPGPPPGTAPAKDRARGRVIELRRQGLSSYEISARLAAEQHPAEPHLRSPRSCPRRASAGCCAAPNPRPASTRPPRAGTPTCPPPGSWTSPPGRPGSTPPGPGCCSPCPTWSPWTCPPWSPPPATPAPASSPRISWLLSLLALKLTGTRRVSHVDDLLADPAAALFAGLTALPKKPR